MKYKCKLCNFETDQRGQLGPHYRKKHPKPGPNPPPTPPVYPTTEEIADALLNKVVKYLTRFEALKAENASLKEWKEATEPLLKKKTEEYDRLLRVHNDLQIQINKRGNGKTGKEIAELSGVGK